MQWSPGQSGNPEGAKKRKQFEAAVLRALAGEDFKKLRQIIDRTIELAIEGERWAVEMVRDTLDGKPAQSITAQDEQGRELAIALVAYNPVQVQPQALPAPDTTEAGQRH